ncbi:MAG: cytochrome c biogenesis protein ResB [Planctomycetota bacterium]
MFRWLLNPRLTAGLFALFFLLFGLGLMIPQASEMTPAEYEAYIDTHPTFAGVMESLTFHDMYRSPLLHGLFVCFALQLVLYLHSRVPSFVRAAKYGTPRPLEGLTSKAVLEGESENLDGTIGILHDAGYHVGHRDDVSAATIKNRFSRLGTALFHGAFLLLLLGAWLSQVRNFKGMMVLTEGQSFRGTPEEYGSVTPANAVRSEFPEISLTVDEIEAQYSEKGSLTDLLAALRIEGRGSERTDLRINRPHSLGGGTAVLISQYGISPVVSIRSRRTGGLLDGVIVNLNVLSMDSPVDRFEIHRPPGTVHMRFFPDHHLDDDGNHITKSLDVKNPLFEVRVVPADSSVPEVRKFVKPGDLLPFGPYELKIEEIRRWGLFKVSREIGGPLLITGFVLMVAGIGFRVLFPRKWITVTRPESGGGAVLHGASEWFRMGFEEEFKSIADRLRAELQKAPRVHPEATATTGEPPSSQGPDSIRPTNGKTVET